MALVSAQSSLGPLLYEILGQIVSRHGKQAPVSKTDGIAKIQRSSFINQTSVRTYIGMTNFLHKFVKNLSVLLAPLTRLLGDVPFVFDDACWAAVLSVNKILSNQPVLAKPRFDCLLSSRPTLTTRTDVVALCVNETQLYPSPKSK